MNSWAAIFDWDGVIIDSSTAHRESWERLAREAGRSMPAGYFERGFGMKSRRIIREVLGWEVDDATLEQLDWRKENLYREVIRERGVTPLPGVVEWLRRLEAAGIPRVIATSTHSRNVACAMEILKLDRFFQGLVSGENVTHGKPDPEVFLLAAKKIGATPARSVVFEDAHVGIEAARNAGMRVIGVATTHPAETLRDADRVVSRLDEVEVDEIGGWFKG